MQLTVAQLTKIAGGTPVASNVNSVVTALAKYGPAAGLDQSHRLAHFIAQTAEESGGYRYDREIWGPTAAQKRYDTRTDLGNTPAADGDGKKNAGRGPLQLTGGANIKAYYDWCVKRGYKPPDFVANPDLINTDPWEGLSAIYFWSTHNLNVLADENNIEQITKKINGGLNGYVERIAFYVRAALVLLGYEPTDVTGFQTWAQKNKLLPADTTDSKQVDGDAGPKTRSAMHMALAAIDAGKAITTAPAVKAAPVVSEVQVDVKSPGKGVADAATGAGIGAGALGGTLQTLQEQLTPFSMAGGWIGKLVVALIIIGAVLAIGGLAYRWYASRKKAQTIAALNATPTVSA